MNDLGHRKPRLLLTQEPCTRCPCRLHARSTKEENDPAGKGHDGEKMKGGTGESGTAPRKQGGSNQRGAVGDKAL